MVLFIVISAFSCTKSDQIPIKPAEAALQNATTISSDAVQQIYNQLSADEKFSYWDAHLRFCEDSLAAGFPEKASAIASLRGSLKTSIFEDESDAATVFLNYTLPVWLTNAEKVLTEVEIFELTMQNKFLPNVNIVPEVDNAECFCHVGNKGYSCKKMELGFPSGVTITYGICEAPDPCEGSRRGCGFLWLQSCSGGHCNF